MSPGRINLVQWREDRFGNKKESDLKIASEKQKLEAEAKQAQDHRQASLETYGQTKKRRSNETTDDESSTSTKRRSSSNNTVAYFTRENHSRLQIWKTRIIRKEKETEKSWSNF